MLGAGGSYSFSTGANDITTLAANTGAVTYNDSNALLSGTVGGTSGIAGTATVNLTATSLTGSGTISAPTINLTTANGMSVNVGGAGTGLSATNTASGDIVLTGVNSAFTVGGGGATFSNAAASGGYYISAVNNMQLNAGTANNRYASFTAGGTLTSSGYGNASGSGVQLIANSVTFNGSPATITGALGVISGGAVNVYSPVTAGSISVVGGSINVSGSGASFNSTGGNFVGYTTGDVSVSSGGLIQGNPDVMLTVGGNILINGTLAYPSKIAAISATSVHATFPTLSSGGYAINGVPGVVYDAAMNTGFFAGGVPATLGSGFDVAYANNTNAASTPAVVAAINTVTINTVISATNQSGSTSTTGTTTDSGTTGGTNSNGTGTGTGSNDKDKNGNKNANSNGTPDKSVSKGLTMQCN